ncbi:11844_t:CDS:1 [Ambispora leptoticha]|uniref:11844_t:CDS:1 n=1 Tax=Ambispora leptoticha TaxID=144679 RepID=A0A9N9BT19_9GLOM|nr:11844_t:CDS:1 [Ambispora leptoticha]
MASTLPTLCFHEIFQLLIDDQRTLHSCLLVNRHWCQSAVSYLWRKPFQYTDASYSSSVSLINSLLLCLPNEDKVRIGVKDIYTATFPYVNYLRHLDFMNLARATSDWRSANCVQASPQFVLQILCRHILNSDALLFDLQLDFDTSLDDYDWSEDDWCFFRFPGADRSLSQLRTLNCFGAYDPILLLSASALCTKIESIEVSLDTFGWTRYQRGELMVKAGAETLVALIAKQEKLERFLLQDCPFRGFVIDLSNIFNALRSAQGTLRHVQFSTIDVQGYPLLDVLGQCNNLESIVFSRCQNIGKCANKKPTTPYFPKLKTLTLDKTFVPVPTLRTFAANAGHSLEEVLLRDEGYQENWNAVQVFAVNNPNIKKFQVHGAITELPQILRMVKSWRKLESLSIMHTNDENEVDELYEADYFIVDLGAAIPNTLEHLTIQLDLEFTAESLLRFFQNCQAPLKTLELPATQCILDDHLRVISEYSPRSLEYLNIIEATNITERAIRAARAVVPNITCSFYLANNNLIYRGHVSS